MNVMQFNEKNRLNKLKLRILIFIAGNLKLRTSSQKHQIIGQFMVAEGSYECCTLQFNEKNGLNKLKLRILTSMAGNLKSYLAGRV